MVLVQLTRKTVNNLIEFTEMDSADEVIVPSVLAALYRAGGGRKLKNELLVSEVPF